MVYQYGGGVGFGFVIDCDVDVVKEDVFDEYVSLVVAKDKYGVVLIGSLEEYDFEVDWVVIEVLRSIMRSK